LQGVIDLLKHFSRGTERGGEIASHSDGLAALARKDEGVNRHEDCAPNCCPIRGFGESAECTQCGAA
jgi:hypothetical protein